MEILNPGIERLFIVFSAEKPLILHLEVFLVLGQFVHCPDDASWKNVLRDKWVLPGRSDGLIAWVIDNIMEEARARRFNKITNLTERLFEVTHVFEYADADNAVKGSAEVNGVEVPLDKFKSVRVKGVSFFFLFATNIVCLSLAHGKANHVRVGEPLEGMFAEASESTPNI